MLFILGAQAETKTDVLTWEGLGLNGTSTSYSDFAEKTFSSSAVYAGNAASGKGLYIQLRSSNSNAGIITTKSGGKLKSITIEWNSKTTDRVLSFYAKNEAYTAASDLYGDAAGTLLGEIAANDDNKTLTVTGDYAYLGIRSKSGAQYIDKITIVWTEGESEGGGGDEGGGDPIIPGGDEEEDQSKKDVTIDFTSEAEIKAMGFEVPEKNKGVDILTDIVYKDITITPYKGTTPVRIFCANNDNKQYSLRFYKADKDGNKGGIGITAPAGYKITAIHITGNSNLKNVSANAGTADVSKSSQLNWSADDQKITSVKFENNGTSTVNVNTLTVSLEYIAHLINDTFDFNNAVDAAVSNNSKLGNIMAVLEINDTEGKNPSGAKMTITPNANTADYPADAPNKSCFWLTLAGPQLRLSGGYNGMTVKIESTNAFNKLAFYQTNFSLNTKADKGVLDVKNGEWTAGPGVTVNEVTFTLQADTTEVWKDGKLQEVILNDMGMWWINQIQVDPISDVVIDAANGTELAALVADEMAKYAKPKSLTINLAAGGNYTIANPIVLNGSYEFTLNGADATIDASGLSKPLIEMSTSPVGETNEKEAYLAKDITFKNVKINGMLYQLIYGNKQKYLINKILVENSVICVNGKNKKTIFDFNGGGNASEIIIDKSTIWANPSNAQNGGLHSSQSGHGSIQDLGSEKQLFAITNSTIYNIAYGKTINSQRRNSTKGMEFKVENSIIANSGKKGQFIVGLNGGSANTAQNYIINNNVFNFDGDDVSAAEEAKVQEKIDLALNSIAAVVSFADADNGDFTQSDVKIGDPRWLSGKGAGEATGIDTVKDAQNEEGAWYTIQGVRVAQPTKGIYIHNGKKVVIK